MLQNKLLRVVQAHLLSFLTGIKFSGNAFACSACFIRPFSSSAAWSNWSLPIFPAESFIHPHKYFLLTGANSFGTMLNAIPPKVIGNVVYYQV
jgi:hypothetical protein